MVKRVLIIGGYGNFGSFVAQALAMDEHVQLLIGGRSEFKAKAFASGLKSHHPAEPTRIDISGDVAADIARAAPDIVIHTTGPFQGQTYAVARACIKQGCHYADLADAREFVAGISTLDAEAKARNVLIVSGASSVPCLTAAIIDHYAPQFARLDSIDYGISAAQQTNRGLATTSAILSYVGKAFSARRDGQTRRLYGWQELHSETYPELGRRWFGNCDVPDLALFPNRYPQLTTQRFCAGHEIAALHFGLWLLSWVVRFGLIRSLEPYAQVLLRLAFLFDRFGTSRSGLHMYLRGVGHNGEKHEQRFFLIARSGHGPFIPCMPAILLARQLAAGSLMQRGATPCLDLINLDQYLDALDGLDIEIVREPAHG